LPQAKLDELERIVSLCYAIHTGPAMVFSEEGSLLMDKFLLFFVLLGGGKVGLRLCGRLQTSGASA
jgi:hypothetical protein